MKFLAIPALFAAAVQASLGIKFLNDIPVNGEYKIGTDFELEWQPYDTTPTDTFQLILQAWNSTPSGYYPGPFGTQLPSYDTVRTVLADDVKFVDGLYVWTIEPIDEKAVFKGPGFFYRFTAHFGTSTSSPRAFHIVE